MPGHHSPAVLPEDLTVVIPTFGRHQELIGTVCRILDLAPPPGSILVVDQTPEHPEAVDRALSNLNREGRIRWLRVSKASQPAAMNPGLLAAKTPYVLFHDDDVIPDTSIVAEFVGALNDMLAMGVNCWCVCGQVIQPNEAVVSVETARHGHWFLFNSDRRCFIDDAMAGNLCVMRSQALALGGFDENFVGTAYRCDTDFARRVRLAGGRVLFEPKASLRHLQASIGGARSYGDFLRTWKPHFAVGSYYLALRTGPRSFAKAVGWLPFRAAMTRFHLRKPWFIPATLISNYLAIGWTLWLGIKGPRLMSSQVASTDQAAWKPGQETHGIRAPASRSPHEHPLSAARGTS